MGDLQEMLLQYNPFVNIYKQAAERCRESKREQLQAGVDPNAIKKLEARLILTGNRDPRRYNLPTGYEIAAIIPQADQTSDLSKEIIIQYRGGADRKISEIPPAYATLHYVLPFP